MIDGFFVDRKRSDVIPPPSINSLFSLKEKNKSKENGIIMAPEDSQQPKALSGLVVGNYCHDVLFHDDIVVGENLGGAASFVSNVLDQFSLHCTYISKVGFDFRYPVSHLPIISSTAGTTLFHAHFSSNSDHCGHCDRILRRIYTCDSIYPSDLPSLSTLFDFGLAVGVAGEISPETLSSMLDLCQIVFVDVQALIRTFDPIDGTVGLIPLKESGFYHLLSRIGFLKASAEEAPFIDLEDARKWCSIIVTEGKNGCRIYSKEGDIQIPTFPSEQVDPTGAGDSFLGGFVLGFVNGLSVLDAALLGNFFGSLTVRKIGVPKFDSQMLEVVATDLLRRTRGCNGFCNEKNDHRDYNQDLKTFLGGLGKLQSSFKPDEEQKKDSHSKSNKQLIVSLDDDISIQHVVDDRGKQRYTC